MPNHLNIQKCRDISETRSNEPQTGPLSKKAESIAMRILIVALVALVMSIVLLAAVPPVDRDALTHHLAVPKMYLRNGGIYEIPHVPFSYYPMNLDLLYMIPLYFGNDIVPKYIHFGFALLTAGVVISHLYRRLCSPTGALLGGLLFLSLPVIIKLSITVYVDLGLIFFSTAALLQLLRWVETGYRLKYFVLSGVFAGLSMGTKPNGLLAYFLLVSAIPFLYHSAIGTQWQNRDERQRAHSRPPMALKALGLSAAFAAIALMVYSPWMLRNYYWTGNPVYPMAVKFFGPHIRAGNVSGAVEEEPVTVVEKEETHEQREGYGPFILRKMVYGETLFEILTIPLRIFFQGQDDNPRLFDGRLNPYLLIFPIVAILGLRVPRNRPLWLQMEVRLLGVFSLLYLLFAFFLVDMRIRYIGPIIPPLTILAVIGLCDLIGFIKTRCPVRLQWLSLRGAGVVFLAMLALNAAYLAKQFDVVDPISYLQGKLSREEYIQKFRPEYAALSFANQNLPETSRILGLFNGNRIYYSQRDLICDSEAFRDALHASRSAADLARQLESNKISHLLVRLDLFNHWAKGQFGESEQAVLHSFFREKLRRLYLGHGYALYAIEAG
jgi:4-amino-4-deoxy-L-arabinose transferase-like glycosyltransferase